MLNSATTTMPSFKLARLRFMKVDASEAILEVAYRRESKDLYVRFAKGRELYCYHGVTKYRFEQLSNVIRSSNNSSEGGEDKAASVGKHFNRYIHFGDHTVTKIKEQGKKNSK